MGTEPFHHSPSVIEGAGGTVAPHSESGLLAAAEPVGGLDGAIEAVFGPIADLLSAIVFFEIPVFGGIPVIVLWLMAAAVFITVYLRFQPITGLKHSFRVIRGKATRKTDPGEVSSFQALATELSGTVGLGNIAGVAVAITVGGPGAALWIIIFGFFAMTVKMAEATLGVKYRQIAEDGTTAGGPMYYLRDGLAAIGRPKTGRFLAVFYSIATLVGVFGAGNLFQSNQAAAVLVNATGGDESWLADKLWLIGLVMAAVCALVVLGGIKKIAEWTSAITPLMAILYFIGTVAVIGVNFANIPSAIALMFQGAFTGQGVTGGIIGVAVVGIQRALFSNAAGVGSAGMAHSASKTTDPATEGFTALWEPLVDSIIICTLTSLAIITTGLYDRETDGSDMAGVELTAQAFGTVTPWFPVLLTICVVLFGFSTILAYSYYGQKAIGYLFKENRSVEKGYQIAWVIAVVVGASISLDSVIAFSDAMFFLMSIPNLLGVYFLSRVLRLEILRFRTKSVLKAHDEIPLELQVGLRDHEPTRAQVRAEKQRLELAKEKRRAIRREFRAAQRARTTKD
ncbi:alanine/glycine:cation symporter family protein [Brevibacterium yomogidense]|uniref:alanine/glycine:cation symporter family protein n=1 Tax=Brevibacterium yomogidense TaxID=946573 RepID=UPI0018E0281F|nr:amino acid carrier protein [Brevibacterium yomogidense]